MKIYKVTHFKSWNFYIEASSPEEALQKFREEVRHGEIDFNIRELYSSSYVYEREVGNTKKNE